MDREYEEKLSHLNDLISLSKADGKESHIESGFINSIADRLGIDRAAVERIKSGQEKIAFSAPKTERQVIEQFHRMIILMGIDKMIYKEEVSFCFELGVKMGLNYNAIMEVLRKTLRNPAYIMQVDEMEEIFRRYSN
jgi:hypothetical protein